MLDKLITVFNKQHEALKNLLILLDKQYKLIMNKDVFGLESIVEEIQLCNRSVAQIEVERRQILGDKSVKEVVQNLNNQELDKSFRDLQKLLNQIILQKDTNDLLIKQQLSFTNRMLNIINPKREVPVYNSYGNIKR